MKNGPQMCASCEIPNVPGINADSRLLDLLGFNYSEKYIPTITKKDYYVLQIKDCRVLTILKFSKGQLILTNMTLQYEEERESLSV